MYRSVVPSAIEMAESFKKGFLHQAGRSWGDALLTFFSEFLARVRRCIAEKSFSPLWGVTWDPVNWCDEVRMVMRYYPLLTTIKDVSPQ